MGAMYMRDGLSLLDRQRLFHEEKKIFLGYGEDVADSFKPSGHHKEVEVWLDQDLRTRHALVVGTTGSGKTVLLSSLVKADILAGNRVVYVDPKGDEDLFKTVVAYAKMTGRFTPETFMFLSPMYLDYSIELNPLWGLDPDEAATVLVSSIPDGKEPFFKKVAFMVLLAILLGKAANNKNPANYPSIYEVTLSFSLTKLQDLEEAVRETLKSVISSDDSQMAMYAADAKLVLEHLTSADEAYFEKVTTTLKAEIDVLVTGSIGQVIGKAKTNRLVERLINDEDVIFLAYLGALRFGDEIVGRAARMIFASLQRLTGKLYQNFGKFNPPLAVYGDEAKNLFYDGIEDLFNKVRGANVMLTFATQSLGDIVGALGPEKTESIVGNTNTQVFMKATDKSTKEFVENAAINVDVMKAIFVDKELGLQSTKQKAIEGSYLGELKPGAFFVSVDGLWYQLYTPYEKVPSNLDFKPSDVFGVKTNDALKAEFETDWKCVECESESLSDGEHVVVEQISEVFKESKQLSTKAIVDDFDESDGTDGAGEAFEAERTTADVDDAPDVMDDEQSHVEAETAETTTKEKLTPEEKRALFLAKRIKLRDSVISLEEIENSQLSEVFGNELIDGTSNQQTKHLRGSADARKTSARRI